MKHRIITIILVILFCLALCIDWPSIFISEERNYSGITEWCLKEKAPPIDLSEVPEKFIGDSIIRSKKRITKGEK